MTNRHFTGAHWRALALLLGLIGLYLAVMGGQLALLGGSPYYVVAGLAVLASAVLLWRGDRRAAAVYFAMLAGTAAWSLWETGTEGWQLVARLAGPVVLALPFVASALWRKVGGKAVAAFFAVLALAVVGTVVSLSSFTPGEPDATQIARPADGTDGEWRTWGRTDSGTRFAPFGQVNQSNVGKLQVAWTYRAGHKMGENTPLMVGDTLYGCTGNNVVFALDAETGKEKWKHDPKMRADAYGRWCRGVAYHEAPAPSPAGDCKASIYVSTRDARLIALDASTGRPCTGFGEGGTVNLNTDMGGDPENYLYASSPAIVVGNLVIVANCVYDGQSTTEPPGVVRAFNATTGQLVWAWDPARPDITGKPPAGEHYTLGTPDVWSVMSADPALGLVYLPTGNAPPDYYGGHRTPALDKYSASVVALDAKTGKLVWAFQTVHHDIWDYDVPSQPVLFDYPTAAGKVPALLQPTKQGELFVLDRRTGKPILPVTERKTPQGGTVKEDWVSPTQPFSAFPSLMDPDLREADMWGLTPLDQLWCRVQFKQARYEGLFTPIGEKRPMVRWPGSSGIYNWGSVSIDEDTGMMVTATLHLANYDRLVPRSSPEARKFDRKNAVGHPEIGPGAGGPQRGTPYAVTNPPFFSPLAVPCTEPPFGRVAGVDLNTQKIAWRKPVGTARASGPLGIASGLPLPMGAPVTAGMLVTRGGLSFFAGSQDGFIRAYSTRTGEELWRAGMPVGSDSTPMSYLAPKSGRQIVAVTAGGGVGTTQSGDYLIAYALPSRK